MRLPLPQLSLAFLVCTSACRDERATIEEPQGNRDAGADEGADAQEPNEDANAEGDAEVEGGVDACAPTEWVDVAEPQQGATLAVNLLNHGRGAANVTVRFDEQALTTDDRGRLESTKAALALTIPSFGAHGDPLDSPLSLPHYDSASRLTILAPRLGDTLTIDLTTFGEPGDRGTPFALHVPPLPDVQTPVDVTLVAGERGCAREPSRGAKVGETVRLIVPAGCTGQANDELVAVAGAADTTLGIATVTVPAFDAGSVTDAGDGGGEGDAGAGDAAVPTIQVGPWLALEPLSLAYTSPSSQPLTQASPAQATLEMQRQGRWIPLATRPVSETGEVTFQVARSITDSFRASIERADSWLAVRQPASTETIAIEDGPPLPRVSSVDLPSPSCGENGALRWRLSEPEAHADAVVLSLSKTDAWSTCCRTRISWTIIAPPEVLAIPVSFLDKFELNRITYVDVDQADGYREFLALTLAASKTGIATGDLPDGRRVRARTFQAPRQ